MIECPDQRCAMYEASSHLHVCKCHCCHNNKPGEGDCGCGRLGPHGCEFWVDDRDHPDWVNVVADEFGQYTHATCGPCREAVSHG